MSYLKLATRAYPIQEGDIRLEHPEIREDQTGDTFPIPEGYVKVVQTAPPSFDFKTQFIQQGPPTLIEGVWQSTWIVGEYTSEQLTLNAKIYKEFITNLLPPNAKSTRPSNDLKGDIPNVIE